MSEPLGTLRKARSQLEPGILRSRAGNGRAGQALEFGESRVMDGAIANSVTMDRRGPRQDDQFARTRPLWRSRLRIPDQSMEPREPTLKELAA